MEGINKMSKFHIVLSREEAEEFKEFLKVNRISYEASGYYESIYLSITATEEEAEAINQEFERYPQ